MNFFRNLSHADVLECLNETLPFFKKENFILESSYPLTPLDLMELLIVMLSKEISIVKFNEGLRDYNEKLKIEQENAKRMKKSSRMPQSKRK